MKVYVVILHLNTMYQHNNKVCKIFTTLEKAQEYVKKSESDIYRIEEWIAEEGQEELDYFLHPCPFCGSEAELRFHEEDKNMKYIGCRVCDATSRMDESKYNVVSAWNKRVGKRS